MNANRPELEAQIEHLQGLLHAAAHERHQLLNQLALYRTALVKIADAESGMWGKIAAAALHPRDQEGPA